MRSCCNKLWKQDVYAYGIFNLGNVKKEISLKLKDGIYQNILYPNQVKVNGGKFKLTEKPMILFAMKKKI